ncbi:MAG: cupredoxin domain-containing protein [Actinomycetota bacterium]|nr:cupredoxin domain-containing protein [Actinomycetota bacterium]
MTATLIPEAEPTSENGASAREPAKAHLPTDQEKFDAEVNRKGGVFLQALGAVGIVTAIGIATLALVVATQNHTSAMIMPSTPVAAVPTVPVAQTISLSVAGSIKKGPDGKLHDAFSKTNFAVKAGQPTQIRIDNKDASPHSITAPGTGVSIIVNPGVHTYTMTANKAGRFEWTCLIPCDSDAHGWAMTHPGYMAGYITVS